jgi:hypothetical protein
VDLIEEAAALWESHAQNHAFIVSLYESKAFRCETLRQWLHLNTAYSSGSVRCEAVAARNAGVYIAAPYRGYESTL